jgi:hypothetical protein
LKGGGGMGRGKRDKLIPDRFDGVGRMFLYRLQR